VTRRGYFGAVGLVALVAGKFTLIPKRSLEMTTHCPLNLLDLHIVEYRSPQTITQAV